MESSFEDRFGRFFVGLLVVLFGAGSWMAIVGIWVELPMMVASGIPEGYNLASYLVVITQIANIGPILFRLASHFFRGNKLEVPSIYLMLSTTVISCLLLIFFWDVTTYWSVFGEDRSTALLSLAFILALCNCTSSVTFIPFMVRLKSSYMTLFFVGQGFSALAPSLVALGQGVGYQECIENYTLVDDLSSDENCTIWMSQSKPANFPPENYYAFLTAAMTLSLLAFLFLNTLPVAKKEFAEEYQDLPAPTSSNGKDHEEQHEMIKKDECTNKNGAEEQHQMLNKGDSANKNNPAETAITEDDKPRKEKRSSVEYAFLFTVLGIVNALGNGVLPSIETYSAGAYGLNAYLLSATLEQVANPVACFVVMFFPQTSLLLVGATCLVGMLMGGYCIATAALSPTPPLQDEVAGIVLVVIAWIMVGGCFSHVKATIGLILRNEPDNHRLLTWYGVVTQLGSLIGAVIMFPLVNVLSLFEPFYNDPCDGRSTCYDY